MANLLYLVHRLPYPPNKGDKVRSYHVLKQLAAEHRVFLGTFVDDPDDWQHVDAVRSLCADVHVERLNPRLARVASLAGLGSGDALTLHYYRNAELARWVDRVATSEAIDAAVVFSSSMVQYARRWSRLPMLLDLVDVDSAKWADYAAAHRWPVSWLYRRESRRLLEVECNAVAQARRAFLVTANEVALFESLAPKLAGRVEALGNGVDNTYFMPDSARPSPFGGCELPLVFTGAMDYWPNVDAVTWFAQDVLPVLRSRLPALRLHVVGRSPAPAVQALAGDAVSVTGTVPDVRPYLQHAAAVVAPLRLARGVQNKVLEAMAMARPVVCATACIEAIGAVAGQHLLAADTVADYGDRLTQLLTAPRAAQDLGHAAREFVTNSFGWQARLGELSLALNSALPGAEPNIRLAVS